MKETIFQDCLKHQQNSHGKPFWEDLVKKYPEYRNGEHLRNSFKKERGKRGMLPIKADTQSEKESSYEEGTDTSGNEFIHIVCDSERIMSQDDIITQFKVDLSKWEVEKFKVKTSEGYRKDRSVEWHVLDGKVNQGDVSDSGKMLVVPLYHIEVSLKKRIIETRIANLLEEMRKEVAKFVPVYPKISYPKQTTPCLFEITLPDIHFGRLSWSEESGENYDIKIAKKAVDSVITKLLLSASQYPVGKILLVIGNDFFNSDNPQDTTAHGTPMSEDVRWQKTFRKGWEMAVNMIDQCATVAPVDVLIVPGNHDTQRTFFLGEVLSGWYAKSPNVTVNNEAKTRKYYSYGVNLIGFAHGYDEKLDRLPLLMAVEKPDLWAKSLYREWHTGDKHHLKTSQYLADESSGIVVRILRSLVASDAWTFNKGFVPPLRAGEAFLWHPTKGLVAQFTATPDVDKEDR